MDDINLHKHCIGERRLRRCAKTETEKAFADISEVHILEAIIADNAMHYSIENQDITQNSIDNISESVHSNDLQLSEEIIDDENSNNEHFFVRYDLLDRSMQSDENSNYENEENDDEDEQVEFRQWLRKWNLKHNITIQACRELLVKLKPYHPNLPLDPRTLNETPKVTSIVKFSNGSYVHVGLISGLERRLENSGLKNVHRKKMGLDVNIDGINITKSCVTDVWPILCRSLDLIDERPYVVGIFVGSAKKYAIADLVNTVRGKSFIEVCVVAWNWISDDGSSCVYPTYLPSAKQAIAIEDCMEPNFKFISYPSTIRMWFSTYQEARTKLDRATMHTDIESGVEDKATRAKRKKKRFEEESDEDIDDDTDEELENKPRKQSKKGEAGSNTKTLKMQPPQLPTFNALPATPKSAPNILARKSAPTSNEPKKLDKSRVLLSRDKNVEKKLFVTYERKSKVEEKVLDHKVKANVRLKPNNTSTPCKTIISKPSCCETFQGNANRDNIPSSNEDDILDRTYDTQDDVSYLSESSSKSEENTRTPVDRSPESATQEEEQIVDDLSQEEETDKADEKITGVTALWKKMYEKIAKIEQRQANMASNVEEIKQLILSKTETLTHPKDLPKLPLQTYADSIHLEEKIYREEAKKDYVIKRLCLATRGASDKECAKRVMEKLMSNHVGTFYSWQGSGGKKDTFKNSIMMETVRLAVKKLRNDVDMGRIEDSIKDWLKSRKFAKNNAVANIE